MTESPPATDVLGDQPRRGFFASAAAIVIGGIVGLVPLVAGTLFFLDPLFRKKDAKGEDGDGDEGFIKVDLALEDLKKSPVPVQVSIIASKMDKWNRYPDQPIGSVYLQASDDGKTVTGFNVTCPHLGCAVEYRVTPDESQEQEFYCPCHTSAFKLSGEKKNEIPPRGLDELDVKIVKNKEGVEEIWVKYQEFRATLSEKVPV